MVAAQSRLGDRREALEKGKRTGVVALGLVASDR